MFCTFWQKNVAIDPCYLLSVLAGCWMLTDDLLLAIYDC